MSACCERLTDSRQKSFYYSRGKSLYYAQKCKHAHRSVANAFTASSFRTVSMQQLSCSFVSLTADVVKTLSHGLLTVALFKLTSCKSGGQ